MVLRTWTRVLLIALGAAALAATSQAGLVYGLGIVRLTRVFQGTARDEWPAHLAWLTWIAMLAAVAGALVAARFARRDLGDEPGPLAAVAVAAGLGAAAIVPLSMQPARTAQVAGTDPVIVIAICASLGAVAGMIAGYVAIRHREARLSILVLSGVLWLLAIVSVAPSVVTGDRLPTVRLGVFDAGFLAPATTQRYALFTLPALALIAGAVLGWLARRQGLPQLTIGLAGLAGPALVTLAYLIAGPGVTDHKYQSMPYWAAVVATAAGVLGSVLAAMIQRASDTDEAAGDSSAAGADATAEFPLPRRSGADPADDPTMVGGHPNDRPGAPFGAGPPAGPRPPGGAPFPGGGPPGGVPPGGPHPGAYGGPPPGGDPELSDLVTRRSYDPGESWGGRPQRRPAPPPPERRPLQPPPMAPPPASALPPLAPVPDGPGGDLPQQRRPAPPGRHPGDDGAVRPIPHQEVDYVDWVGGLGADRDKT